MSKRDCAIMLVALVAWVALTAAIWQISAPQLRANDIKLGQSESLFVRSDGVFKPADSDAQIAENGYQAMMDNDSLCSARCRGGRCISIQAAFAGHPITRQQAMSRLYHYIPVKNPRLIEHDDYEVRNISCATEAGKVPALPNKAGKVKALPGDQPTEYFYFQDDYKAEFGYDSAQDGKILWINVWRDIDHRDRV